MQRHIYLENLSHVPTPAHDDYSPEIMGEARKALERAKLKWDNATGCLHNNRGLLERPSNPSDHTPHTTEHEVMQWEFRRCIANAASRKNRGYSFT